MKMWMKSMARLVGARGVGVVLLCVVGVCQAQPRIQSITSSIQGGAEVVRIELSEPLTAVPTGFVVQSPARIALDLPGVSSDLQRNAVELNHGNLRKAGCWCMG